MSDTALPTVATIDTLQARIEALEADNAALRARLESKPDPQVQQHQTLIENSPDIFVLLDVAQRVTFLYHPANGVMPFMVGKALPELAEDAQVKARIQAALDQVKNTLTPTHYEVASHSEGAGEVRDFLTIIRPLLEAGELVGYHVVSRDVTVRKQAEITIREQQGFLRKIIDLSPDFIFVKDWEGRFILANETLAAAYGTTAYEMIGKTDADYSPTAAEVENFLDADRAVMRSGQPKFIPSESVTHADGVVRHYQTRKIPLFDADGKARRMMGVASDITERIEADSALRESEETYRTLFESFFDGLVVTRGGIIYDANPAMEAMLGFARHEMTGVNAVDFIAPAYRQKVAMNIQQNSVDPYEAEAVRRDGTRFPIEIQGKPFEYHGEPARLTAVRDITQRKAIAEERERLIRQLEDSLVFKDQFLATMSHELRTPLNAVLGYSGVMAQRTGLDPEVKRVLQRIKLNSQRLLNLINDILDISRINAQRVQILSRPIDIRDLVAGWHMDFQKQAHDKGLALTFEVAPTLPPTILGDEERLTQIANNLLQNAIKFTEEGQVMVAILYLPMPQQWQLVVSDTGIGIPESWQHLIFDEFRQVDGTSRRKYGGAGLGLSIVQKLCLLMGGSITVQSKLSEGTTFKVTLPLTLPATTEVE